MPKMAHFLLLLAMVSSLPAAGQIRLHGSNTIGEELAPALVRGWLESDGFDQIEIQEHAELERTIVGLDANGQSRSIQIHAHGSSTSFRDLETGMADLGMSSRRIRPNEVSALRYLGKLDQPENEFVVGIDGLAVIVHPSNPIAALGVDQIRAIFSGAIRNWREVGGNDAAIVLYARAENSGTWDSFKSMVLQDAPLAGALRFESSSELSDRVAADPDGIGFIGLPYVRSARALAVSAGGEAILPERFSSATEDYPLSRRLYLYVPDSQLQSAAGALARYAISRAGQEIVDRIGFVGQDVTARRVALPANAPDAYKSFVEGALRASLNFRFQAGRPELDSKSQRDLQRLVEFLGADGNRGIEVLLMGFADASETMKYFSLTLSHDRVDYVASLLLESGITVRRARGFGDALVLAQGTGPLSQAKNRRVEVWFSDAP